MKLLLATAALIGAVSNAAATPWVFEAADTWLGAYQWVDGTGNVLLGYECDSVWQGDGFYIQAEDKYDPEAGYAPDVPTQFVIDGVPQTVTGVYQERDGYVFTYYGVSVDGAVPLFNSIIAAKDRIDVQFYDKSYSFSAEGAADALRQASVGCP